MLALTLAFLAACAAKVALSGFDDVGTLTALVVLAMSIMPAFTTVGLAGIGLILACLVSPVCPSFRSRRGIAGFYALYHLTKDQIIGAHPSTLQTEARAIPRTKTQIIPAWVGGGPTVAFEEQDAGAWNGARHPRKSDSHQR